MTGFRVAVTDWLPSRPSVTRSQRSRHAASCSTNGPGVRTTRRRERRTTRLHPNSTKLSVGPSLPRKGRPCASSSPCAAHAGRGPWRGWSYSAVGRAPRYTSQQRSTMSTNHLLVWNACGLNNRARRNVVHDVAEQQRASIVCLQETKVANLSASMNADLTGASFDFACLPAIGVAGGAVTSWRRDLWSVSSSCVRRFSVTVKLSPADGHAEPWWLTNVYGPATRAGKPDFFQELRDIHASCPGRLACLWRLQRHLLGI